MQDGPGHMEGHNTHGGVASMAAFAVKQVMQRYNLPGTVAVSFGPAEEQIASRPYIVRAGYFKDVDAAIVASAADSSTAASDRFDLRRRSGAISKAVVPLRYNHRFATWRFHE